MADTIKETKLILAPSGAAAVAQYLMGFGLGLEESKNLWLGLGNISIENVEANPNDPNDDGKKAVFTEIAFDKGATEDDKTTNYARTLVRETKIIPMGEDQEAMELLTHNLLAIDTNNAARIYNKEQIVFNKVKATQYTANAIGLFRTGTESEKPFAFGMLESELVAVVGSLPMFERNKLVLCMPDGGDLVIP